MLVSLIVTAITFVFGLFFLSGSLGYAGNYSSASGASSIGAKEFVEKSQGYVKTFVNLAIVFIVLAVLLFVTSCNKRRNYYVTNYVAIGLFVAFALVMVVYLFIMVTNTRDLFLNSINWTLAEAVSANFPEYPMNRSENYQFIIGYIVGVIIIIDAVLLVLSTVWKILLMKGEKKLLEQSAQVAEEGVKEVV